MTDRTSTEGFNRGSVRRFKTVVASSVVLGLVALMSLAAAPALAATCMTSGQDAQISSSGDSVTVKVGNVGEILVNGLPCGTRTVTNTDAIVVDSGDGSSDTLTIDMTGGVFSQGVGDDEIKFDISLGSGSDDTVIVKGGPSNDFFDATTSGIKLNDDKDVDVTYTDVEAVVLRGGAGADTLKGSSNVDSLFGGRDNDELLGGDGADSLNAGAGDDLASGGNGADTIRGGAGDDTLLGYWGTDDLEGGDGNDSLSPGAGANTSDAIDGGLGTDTADYGLAGSGVTVDLSIVGNGSVDPDGNQDTGGNGSDDIVSLESLRGSLYDDTLRGDALDNFIFGSGGLDLIEGGAGNDTLSGGDGDDALNGNDGDDLIYGGDGEDFCDGGPGNAHTWDCP
jgi:Ca2+-binding RTX toxin-like protein